MGAGDTVGAIVGALVGEYEGKADGSSVGDTLGSEEGDAEGRNVGAGEKVGKGDGMADTVGIEVATSNDEDRLIRPVPSLIHNPAMRATETNTKIPLKIDSRDHGMVAMVSSLVMASTTQKKK